MDQIPVSTPEFTAEDAQIVNECITSGWVTTGDYIEKFETIWANACGRKYGIAVSNGTVALELALEVLINPGDEVLIPSFTIISCAIAVLRAGGIPIPVDCDDTWCIDPNLAESMIGQKTKAIMPVHIYGVPFDVPRFLEISGTSGLPLIEDAAEAHGATFNGAPCGRFGLMSCFSFYGNKIITTGEGGMILTDDATLAAKLADKRNLCFGKGHDRFTHTGIGHNYRLTNIQAALGYSQTKRLDTIVQNKIRVGKLYRELLGNHADITFQREPQHSRPVYWMNGILVPDAQALATKLKNNGIDTRPFFTGMHAQPAILRELPQTYYCPNTDRITKHGLYLPSSPTLTNENIEYICQTVMKSI